MSQKPPVLYGRRAQSLTRPGPPPPRRRSFTTTQARRVLLPPPSAETSDATTAATTTTTIASPPPRRRLRGTRRHSPAARHRKSQLEKSMDSLAFFQATHKGRLNGRGASVEGDNEEEEKQVEQRTHARSVSVEYVPSLLLHASPVRNLQRADSKQQQRRTPPSAASRTRHHSSSPSVESSSSSSSAAVDAFVIPESPRGRRVVFNIRSTWGDENYVGLNGIEFFDDRGNRLTMESGDFAHISADPADINVLTEHNQDPRVVNNLLKFPNCTRDDMFVWLAPFSKGKSHLVVVEFAAKTTLSCIRIWNFNKSRYHSTRGARELSITLDDVLIFKGEIRRAPGEVVRSHAYAENILFTVDEAVCGHINALIESGSEAFLTKDDDDMLTLAESSILEHSIARPSTSHADDTLRESVAWAEEDEVGSTSVDFSRVRPQTAASRMSKDSSPVELSGGDSPRRPQTARTAALSRVRKSIRECGLLPLRGSEFRFELLDTWGDTSYCGLTGVQLLDERYAMIDISEDFLDASPRDVNDVPGHSGDTRTLDKLINGVNYTKDDHNMWLAPIFEANRAYERGEEPQLLKNQFLSVTFPEPRTVMFMRAWNYNKSYEDTFRGVRRVRLLVDGVDCGQRVIRKAIGPQALFDFGQLLFLGKSESKEASSSSNSSSKARESKSSAPAATTIGNDRLWFSSSVVNPAGFNLNIEFVTTWGSPHYVGLNGLELYDSDLKRIPVTAHHVSCGDKEGLTASVSMHDSRTVDKLFDGVNSVYDKSHCWLTPFVSRQELNVALASHADVKPTSLHLHFDAPISLGMIKMWNYSANPSRGVKHAIIRLDDCVIFEGVIRHAPRQATVRRTSVPRKPRPPPDWCHSILFSDSAVAWQNEQHHVYEHRCMQSITFFDQGKEKTPRFD